MIEAWMDLPTAGIFAVLAVLYAATAAAIVWTAFGDVLGPRVRTFDGVVAPFFTAVSVLFALLTGFLANDVADRNRQAARAVQTEAAELRSVYTLSVASTADMHGIRGALADYARTVVRDEWPAMEHDRSAPSASTAYDALLREVSDPAIAQAAGAAIHSALLTATVRAGAARSERIALAADRTNEIKWGTVLLLGVITQIAIALVHLQKRKAQTAALTVFSAAAVVALGMIALQERPFAGDVRIASDPLEDILHLPVQ